MSATRKGLFELARRNGGWEIADAHFLGDPLSAVLASPDGAVYAALDLGHFGAKLWRRDRGGSWRELAVPAFPPKPEDAARRSASLVARQDLGARAGRRARAAVGRHDAGRALPLAMTAANPGRLNEPLWRMPERRQWFGVAGGEQPGINSVLIDPRNPSDIRIGVSTAPACGRAPTTAPRGGSSTRACTTNTCRRSSARTPIVQDIHLLARCAAHPEIVWCQHHNGVFRSEDAGANWHELTAIRPSKFGFAVAAHPRDPDTAWFVPAVKDERRIPVDGKVVVARTRDGGSSFEVLSNGLPQRHAYDLVWRHALAVDATGERLAFGSTSGGLWISEDGGDSWTHARGAAAADFGRAVREQLIASEQGSRTTMRFMVMVKANKESEAGVHAETRSC